MEQDQTPSGMPQTHHSDGGFPTTRWSEVARAADADPAVRRGALERLVRQYLPAFRQHLVRRRGLSQHDADDVLQGFLCDQLIASELLTRADQSRGRLRAYFFVAIERYLSRVRRDQRAQKRAPAARMADIHELGDGAGGETEADVFKLEWARQVLATTAARMKLECIADGDADRMRVWTLFERRVLRPTLDDTEPPGYADLVAELRFSSPTQASNALVTGKRMFARLLREVVGEYAADPGEVEAELKDLWEAVSAPSHRDLTHLRQS